MSQRRTLLIANAVCLLGAVALASGVAWQTVTGGGLSEPWAVDTIAGADGADKAATGLGRKSVGARTEYDVVGARDLFREERRPFHTPTPLPQQPDQATPTPNATPMAAPKGLKLTGILRLNRKRVALISESSIDKGEPVPYTRGDMVLAYVVDYVGSTMVRLKNEAGETIELKLRDYEAMLASAAQPQQNQIPPQSGVSVVNPRAGAPMQRTPVRRDENTNKNVNKLLQMMQEGAKRQRTSSGEGDFGFEGEEGGFEGFPGASGFGGVTSSGGGNPFAFDGNGVTPPEMMGTEGVNPFEALIRRHQEQRDQGLDVPPTGNGELPEFLRNLLQQQGQDGTE